jgi:hypothetical protein
MRDRPAGRIGPSRKTPRDHALAPASLCCWRPSFLPIVFAQGFVATLFFGWLPLYLPELFPTRVRAAGSGIAYNVGRFATAVGVFVIW